VLGPHYNYQRAGAILSLAKKMLVFEERGSPNLANRWVSTVKGEGSHCVCCGSRGVQIKDITSPLSLTDCNPLYELIHIQRSKKDKKLQSWEICVEQWQSNF